MKRLIAPAAIVVICLLGTAELVARIFFRQDITGRFAYGYDPDAGFAEHDDGTVELYRAGGRRFHPQSFRKHRSPGVFRIFVVGDSVPRGPRFEEAYPWLLGEELRRRGVQAESINLAVPGYGARRCQIVLEKALEFDPSLIILHLNDTNKWEDEREWRRSQEFQGWHPRHWLMKIFIFRRLYEANMEKVFWPLVPDQIRLKYALNDADAQLMAARDPAEQAARIMLAEEVTAQNVALAQRRHIPLFIITQCRWEPDAHQTMHLTDHGLDALGASLTGSGVYHLSMKEVFAGKDISYYFADSGHMKRVGHELLAQAVFQKIKQEQAFLGLSTLAVAEAGGR